MTLFFWWRRPDLNWGHMPLQGTALPTELQRLDLGTDYLLSSPVGGTKPTVIPRLNLSNSHLCNYFGRIPWFERLGKRITTVRLYSYSLNFKPLLLEIFTACAYMYHRLLLRQTYKIKIAGKK